MGAADEWRYDRLTWPEMNEAIAARQVVLLPTDLTGSGSDDLVLCSLLEDRWTVRVWVRN